MNFKSIKEQSSSDFSAGIRLYKIAFYYAYTEIAAKYKRSILGPFWLVISTGIGVFGLGYMWCSILNLDKDTFIPTIAIGMIVWQLIAAALTEASTNFIKNSTTILNIQLPTLFFSLQITFKLFINLVHSFLILFFILFLFPENLNKYSWLSIIGFIFLFINTILYSQIIGYLGARYRDVEPLIIAVMPILFFMTPVVFRSKNFENIAYFMKLNPISYFIDSIREPLLGHSIGLEIYGPLICISIFGYLFAFLLTGICSKKIPFWL
jgi:ABC-type polysaccharide/polyol phosphate export permease